MLEKVLTKCKDVILMGDLNVNLLVPSSLSSKLLMTAVRTTYNSLNNHRVYPCHRSIPNPINRCPVYIKSRPLHHHWNCRTDRK